jgi:hypothetical protein
VASTQPTAGSVHVDNLLTEEEFDMPYSVGSSKNLPSNVKQLSAKKKRQWVHTFNSSYASAISSGKSEKEAESVAFRNANGVVKMIKDRITKVADSVHNLYLQVPLTTNDTAEVVVRSGNGDILEKDSKVALEVELKKYDIEKRLVYGIVYEPYSKDTDGDWTTPEEIERAAHNFLTNAVLNVDHQGTLEKQEAEVVESYIAPADFEIDGESIKKGTWLLVSKVNNDILWESVKGGERVGYSLEGTAMKADNDFE